MKLRQMIAIMAASAASAAHAANQSANNSMEALLSPGHAVSGSVGQHSALLDNLVIALLILMPLATVLFARRHKDKVFHDLRAVLRGFLQRGFREPFATGSPGHRAFGIGYLIGWLLGGLFSSHPWFGWANFLCALPWAWFVAFIETARCRAIRELSARLTDTTPVPGYRVTQNGVQIATITDADYEIKLPLWLLRDAHRIVLAQLANTCGVVVNLLAVALQVFPYLAVVFVIATAYGDPEQLQQWFAAIQSLKPATLPAAIVHAMQIARILLPYYLTLIGITCFLVRADLGRRQWLRSTCGIPGGGDYHVYHVLEENDAPAEPVVEG